MCEHRNPRSTSALKQELQALEPTIAGVYARSESLSRGDLL
jgi:hypothetical protein